MVEKIINKIIHNFPNIDKDKIILAVSGGIDSMVMLDIFIKMVANIEVVHCNFKLRGEDSDLDEKFVIDYCENHQIKYHIERFNTALIAKELKLSIQETARNLRYSFFTELMIESNISFVLTAHNLNDSFETFMINLSRGTGIDGLIGIPNQNDKILRPLSFLTRLEIEEYAQFYEIKWREDKSNLETKYLRNKIRHKILPIFQEINPSFLQSFSKTLNNLNNTKLLQDIALSDGFSCFIKVDQNGDIKLKIEPFLEFSENTSTYLYGWFQEYGFKDWVAVENLLYAETGKRVEGKNCYLIKEKKHLVLKFKDFYQEKFTKKESEFTLNNEKDFADIGVLFTQEMVLKSNITTLNKIFVDFDDLKYPLILRKINKGDVFFPTGMQGSKKVSKFFKDQNMTGFERECTYILTNATNEIIWIVGHRQDRRFEVTENTNKIIKFEIK